jgi:protein-S-isoprenylcysteine O-methyltransferase Ste14
VTEKMGRFGIGIQWALISIAYCAFTFVLLFSNPQFFGIHGIPSWILTSVGILLIVIGIPFYMAGGIAVQRAYNAGKLCTAGIFSLCRHPTYAGWVIFVVPGIMLLFRSWIGLTAVPFMYITLRIMVRKEDKYLEQKFGDEFIEYKKRVPAVFPLDWLKRK